MSKDQYGVSMRHDPHVHSLVAVAAQWYGYSIQKAFDALVLDRAKKLSERMEDDLRAMREGPGDKPFPRQPFHQVVKELFGIDIPQYLRDNETATGRRRRRSNKKAEE